MKNAEHKWTVRDIPSQEGRLAVVTGATSGIGFYTAKELARKGATVIMPAGDMRKAEEATERIVTKHLSAGSSRLRLLINFREIWVMPCPLVTVPTSLFLLADDVIE